MRAIIATAGKRAELPFPMSGHSLRRGFVTTAHRGGATDIELLTKDAGSAHTDLTEYLPRESRWSSTAAKLGL